MRCSEPNFVNQKEANCCSAWEGDAQSSFSDSPASTSPKLKIANQETETSDTMFPEAALRALRVIPGSTEEV
jgi:hypothetical protein